MPALREARIFPAANLRVPLHVVQASINLSGPEYRAARDEGLSRWQADRAAVAIHNATAREIWPHEWAAMEAAEEIVDELLDREHRRLERFVRRYLNDQARSVA